VIGAAPGPADRDLVFVGDAHFGPADPHLPAFLSFLDGLDRRAGRVVFLGDLFELWLGRPELERPHQHAVLERLTELRRRGVVVRYVEGNRDYRVGDCHVGGALDDATDREITERFGGRRLLAVHGDLANPADRQYRAWRRLSRSRVVWVLFNVLPRRARLTLAAALESRLRGTNVGFRRGVPEAAVRRYAEPFFARGCDTVVLGHFHVELRLAAGDRRQILVVPEWRASRRHLRVTPAGDVDFVDS
jgi:UDP-2,3-diacylglucosamine hydrolase